MANLADPFGHGLCLLPFRCEIIPPRRVPAPAARTDHLTARPSIPAVVPMLDDEPHAATILRALRKALAAPSDDFEILLVNDGQSS